MGNIQFRENSIYFSNVHELSTELVSNHNLLLSFEAICTKEQLNLTSRFSGLLGYKKTPKKPKQPSRQNSDTSETSRTSTTTTSTLSSRDLGSFDDIPQKPNHYENLEKLENFAGGDIVLPNGRWNNIPGNQQLRNALDGAYRVGKKLRFIKRLRETAEDLNDTRKVLENVFSDIVEEL